LVQDQVKALITGPLSEIVIETPQAIVIDALDKYNKESRVEGGQLIPLLVRGLLSMDKVIITSRPEKSIKSMTTKLGVDLLGLHNTDTDVVEGNIRKYLEHHLAKLAEESDLPTSWPSNKDLTALVKRCGLLFVYAATLVRYLSVEGFTPQERLRAILSSESATIEENPYESLDQDVYMHVICAAVFDRRKVNPVFVDRLQRIVGTIVLAQDPLPISALAVFAGLEMDQVQAFLHWLSSVLMITTSESEGVCVFHLLFSDFITNKTRCVDTRFYLCISTHHAHLAVGCLKLMIKHLVRDICGIKDPCLLNSKGEGLQDCIKAKISVQLGCACRHWATHLGFSNTGNQHLCNTTSDFTQTKLLYWIEAMSLLNKLPTTLTQLPQTETWCQNQVRYVLILE
jgi:hypothetical protein